MAVWDSGGLAPREQFEYWHDVICRAFVPLTPHRTVPETGFAATVETRGLAGLNRARISSRPQRTDHGTREVARTEAGYYFVNLQLSGRCATTVRGRTAMVEQGEFVLVDSTEPYFFDFDRPWQMVSYRVPHALLEQALAGRRPALGRPLGPHGAGAVVSTLLTTLWSVAEDAPGAEDLARSFSNAVAAATAVEDAAPAVSRRAVLAFVETHLGGDLGVDTVARRFAVSPRTLHNLFAAGDESFAATVRRLRLDRCAAVLTDPTTTATVTAVGAAHGFGDPTSFSRAFRRRFGVSPREMRASAGP